MSDGSDTMVERVIPGCVGERSRFGRWLVVIVVLAVAARAGMLVFAEWRPSAFDFPDSHRYVSVARNIAAGLGPIESEDVRAGTDPVYPGILSIGVWLGADDDAAVMRFGRFVNVVFGVISVALLALFARRFVGDVAALFAAAILAVDPIMVFFNALVLTETVYVALVLAGFLALTRLGGRRGRLWGAAAGLALGVATVTRSSSLFLPVLVLPFAWHLAGGDPIAPVEGTKRLGRRCVVSLCYMATICAVLVPTIARNYGLFGHFVPVRTGSGASLMEGLGPWADGAPGMDRIVYPAFPHGANEYDRDVICRSAALEWAWDHPGRALALAWAKLRRTWSVAINASDYSSWFHILVAWLTVFPEFLLAICGVWLLRRRPAVLALLLVVAAYFTLLHMVFVGSVRYRVPAMPFVFVLAGVGVERLWRKVNGTTD